MKSLGSFLPLMLEMSQYNEIVCERASFAAWSIAVGPKIARISQPERLANKTLIVILPDDTWKAEIMPKVPALIGQINFLLGKVLVKKIDLRVPAKVLELPVKRGIMTPPITPTIAEAAAKITDPILREIYLRAAASSLDAQGQSPTATALNTVDTPTVPPLDPLIAEAATEITDPQLRQLYI